MNGEHHGSARCQSLQQVHDELTAFSLIHRRRAVHGHEVESFTLTKPEVFQNGTRLDLGREMNEGVDHGVSHHVKVALCIIPHQSFTFKVLKARSFRDEMVAAQLVDQHPVDLFRHGSVKASESRFEVSHRNAQTLSSQGASKCAVDIAGHQDKIGLDLLHQGDELLNHVGKLHASRARMKFKDVVWPKVELIKKDLAHGPVVMLPRVDQGELTPATRFHHLPELGDFDEVGTGSDNNQQMHEMEFNGA
jgi:hypothetical protein